MTSEFSALGKKVDYKYDKPDASLLESFDNKHPENNYVVKLECNEFTAICPVTGQPDFAKIDIEYIPDSKLVESKSLKLYLFSFRNHGEFHEDCVNRIANDIWSLLEPKWIKVTGNFNSRGGIAIVPVVEKGKKD